MSQEVGKLHYDLDIDDKGLDKALDKSDSKVSKFGDKISDMGNKVALGVAAATVATVAFGVSAVKAYAEAEVAQRSLEHAVLQVSHATAEQLKQTEDLADALQRKGVLDGDNIKLGLAQLSTFGLSNKAVQALGGSLADLAVNQFGVNATGEQVADSANMIAKALNGQFGVLEKSGIRFSDAQKKMIEYGTEAQKVTAINEGFAQNLKFTNETALNTFSGSMAKLNVLFGDFQEVIGAKLTGKMKPLIDRFNEWVVASGGIEGVLEKIKENLKKLQPYWQVFAGAILGILVPALVVGTMWLWSFIAPFVVFAGIGALIGLALKTLIERFGGMTVIMQKLQPVTSLLSGLWRDVFYPALVLIWKIIQDYLWPALMRLWETIRPFAPLLLVIAAIVVGTLLASFAAFLGAIIVVSYTVSILIGWLSNLINWIGNVAGVLRNAANNVLGFFADVLGAVLKVINKIKSVWGGLGEDLRRAIGDITNIIFFPFKTAFNLIAKAWNNTVGRISFDAPDWVPGLGGKKWGVPKVPEFNKGVENFGGGLAYVHQGELLANLSPGTSVIKKSDVQQMMGSNGSSGSNVTINLSGIMTESREGTRQVARTLIQALNEGLKAKGMEEIKL